MGYRICYDHSTVTGYKRKENGGYEKPVTEDFIHQRQQDPVLMACKRNHRLAGCDQFFIDTQPAFERWVDLEPHKGRKEIPALWVPEYEY